MADAPVVHIGENSAEYVAYRLMKDIQNATEAFKLPADQLLDLYGACLMAVKNPHQRGESHKTGLRR